MKQNLLTIIVDKLIFKKFPKKLNFFKFFSFKALNLKSSLIFSLFLALSFNSYAENDEQNIDCSRLMHVAASDDPLIIKCIELANKGDANASYDLGKFYRYGNESISPNIDESLQWLRLAEQQGSLNASLELGLLYYNGELVAKDLNLARDYLKKASDTSDQAKMLLIEITMREAYDYDHGTNGVERNDRKALKKYLEVAKEQSVYQDPARIALGNMYLNGKGTLVDYTQAFYWFNLALPKVKYVNKDNQYVAVLKATMYRKGMGVKQDYKNAKIMYEHLIKEFQNPVAMFELANMYSYGVGVEQNYDEALKLYQDARSAVCNDFVKINGYPNICAVIGYELANINKARE